MSKILSSNQAHANAAISHIQTLPASLGEADQTKSHSTGFQSATSPSPASPSANAVHGLFKWFGKLKDLSVECDLKLVEEAKRNKDLILARDIIDKGGHGAFLSDERKKDAYVALHRSPAPWIEAAKHHRDQGDYLKALEHMEYALFIAQEEVHAQPATVNGKGNFWTVSFSTKSNSDPLHRLEKETVLKERDTLREEIKGLKGRIQSLQQSAEVDESTLRGSARDQASERNEFYTAILSQIDYLDGLKLKSVDLGPLTREAKTKILGGVLHQNPTLLTEGMEIGAQLQKYDSLEENSAASDQMLDAMTITNSRFSLEMDPQKISGQVGLFEMSSKDVLKTREDLKLYAELKKNGDPLIRDWDRVVAHRKSTAFFRMEHLYDADGNLTASPDDYDPVKDGSLITSHREKTPRSLQELTQLNQWREEKVAIVTKIADKFQAFAGARATQDRPATPTSEDLTDSVDELQKFPTHSALLEIQKEGKVEPELVQKARDFLTDRAEQYNRYFSHKKTLLLKEHEKYRLDADNDGVGRITRKLDRLDKQWTSIETDLAQIKSLKIDSPETAAAALPILSRTIPSVMSASERRIRASFQDALEELPDAGALKQELVTANRPEDYKQLLSDLGAKALPFDIDRKIDALKAQRKRAGRADLLSDVVHNRLLAHHEDPFSPMIDELKAIRELVSSNDASTQERGLAAYSLLEGASVVHRMNGKNQSSRWVPDFVVEPKEFLIGAALVAGAAFTAGTATRFLGPTVGRYIGGELGVNALTFTISHRLLDGLAHGRFLHELKRLATDPVGTLKETLLMAGMMKFVGKFSHGAMKGALRLGVKGGALWTTGFVAEIAGFRGWSLIEGVMFNPHIRTFSDLKRIALQNPLNDAAFILALRAGGLSLSPISGRLDASMEKLALKTMGLDVKKVELDRLVDRLAHEASRLAHGKGGDALELLHLQERVLSERAAYLKDLPAKFRDKVYDTTVGLNDQALANVRQFRSAYEKSTFRNLDLPGKNPLGLHRVAANRYSYSGSQAVDLLRQLKADPTVSDVKIHDNGLVEVQMTDPLGRSATVKLTDRGYTANVAAMKKYWRSNASTTTVEKPADKAIGAHPKRDPIFVPTVAQGSAG